MGTEIKVWEIVKNKLEINTSKMLVEKKGTWKTGITRVMKNNIFILFSVFSVSLW
jgi:hypothetical protein